MVPSDDAHREGLAVTSFVPGAICLSCRTGLAPGQSCDGGRSHQIADLTTMEGRDALLNEVWGPASRRRKIKELVRAGAVGSGAGAILDGFNCGGCDLSLEFDSLVVGVLIVVTAGLLFVLGQMAVRAIADVRRRRLHLRPFGAVERPRLPPRRGCEGLVEEAAPLLSPLGGVPCAVYAISLRAARPAGREDVLYREAATEGLSLRLDDGRLVRVPPGRVRLEARRRGARSVPREAALARLRAAVGDPLRGDGELALFPFDEACEDVVRPGERLTIVGELALREDLARPRPALREAAPTVLVPTGVPTLLRAT